LEEKSLLGITQTSVAQTSHYTERSVSAWLYVKTDFILCKFQYFCKNYIKKYEKGESCCMCDVEDRCPVISLGKPERVRTTGRPIQGVPGGMDKTSGEFSLC